jgi:eukaryotic-like serine/threonine-protein kinase
MGREDPSAWVQGRLGRVLKNKWRIERLLAVGGMGAVYEAAHRNGKRVAIKMLYPELCRDPVHRKRFLREGYAANAIGDPRVVTVDDDDVDDDGAAFLVMELLDGESLDRMLKRNGPLSPSTTLEYADQLLGVLELAHALGIVHRDIKPENLFVTKSGALKVLDFGIARLREQAAPVGSDTSEMAIMGTPAYMAPEQAKGRWSHVDGRSDLWSVGATMFRLLSGQHVHEAETRNEQLGLAMTAPARSLALVAPALDPGLIALVDRALEYEMKDRWESAREMRRALRALLPASLDSVAVDREAELAEDSSSPAIAPASRAVVATMASTLSMEFRHEPAAKERAERARQYRRPVWVLALSLLIVTGAIWSALSRGNAKSLSAQEPPAAPQSVVVAVPAPVVTRQPERALDPPGPPTVSGSPSPLASALPVRTISEPVNRGADKSRGREPAASRTPDARAGSGAPASTPALAAPPVGPPPDPTEPHDPLDRRR